MLQVNHRVHHPTNQFIPGVIGRVKKNHARWVEFPVRPESHDPRGPFPHAALFAFETGPDLLDGLVRPGVVEHQVVLQLGQQFQIQLLIVEFRSHRHAQVAEAAKGQRHIFTADGVSGHVGLCHPVKRISPGIAVDLHHENLVTVCHLNHRDLAELLDGDEISVVLLSPEHQERRIDVTGHCHQQKCGQAPVQETFGEKLIFSSQTIPNRHGQDADPEEFHADTVDKHGDPPGYFHHKLGQVGQHHEANGGNNHGNEQASAGDYLWCQHLSDVHCCWFTGS